jgi:hypothetical protein
MLNRRSNIVLAAGVTLAITVLSAPSASASASHASSRGVGQHQASAQSGQSSQVRGISNPGKVMGISNPGNVKGIAKPPIAGIYIPPKVPGVVPKFPGILIPPVTGVEIIPPSINVLPPEEVTWTRRRYPWYARNTVSTGVSTAQPVMNTAAAPCNCLTKEYLQDGSVLFKDLCTKEAALLTVEEMKAKM